MFCLDCESFIVGDFDFESSCIDGIIALLYVTKVLSARGLGFWIAAYESAYESAYQFRLTVGRRLTQNEREVQVQREQAIGWYGRQLYKSSFKR